MSLAYVTRVLQGIIIHEINDNALFKYCYLK